MRPTYIRPFSSYKTPLNLLLSSYPLIHNTLSSKHKLPITTSSSTHTEISTMLPYDVASLIHYLSPENPSTFSMIENINTNSFNHFNTPFLINNMPINSQPLSPPPGHDFSTTTPQSSSTTYGNSNNYNNYSSSTTSDEADELQLIDVVIDERKKRRMVSNRESARRSRMRKQKHLDELRSQVVWLRTENRSLVGKLNHVSECHERAVQENARLKEEASSLRQLVADLKISSPPYLPLPSHHDLRDLEEEIFTSCNTAHLRAESSNQPINSSTNLLH